MVNRIIDKAAELLRINPELKYYEAIERAKEEFNEMDRGTVSRVYEEEKRISTGATNSKKK